MTRPAPDEEDIQAYRAWCADEGIRKQREDEEAAQIMAPVMISVLSDPDALAAAIAVVLKKKREDPTWTGPTPMPDDVQGWPDRSKP